MNVVVPYPIRVDYEANRSAAVPEFPPGIAVA
jgi:hypothetical protein